MAGYRKLGRTSSQRKALLRNQVTNLLYHGRIITTEAKAKEIRKIAEKIIALGIKECNNYDTVTVTAKVPRKDKDGKRVKEVVDGKKVTVYDEVQKEIRKDQPSRLHARKQMSKTLYKVTEVPKEIKGRKKNTISPNQLFSYDNSNDKIYTSTVNTQDYVAWKDGYYQFKHQKMNIVLEKLCKYYGVKIHWDDKVSELTCSGKLDLKDDLDKVFNALRNAAPIEIEQTNEFINIIVKH